jgi:hypothetical protein
MIACIVIKLREQPKRVPSRPLHETIHHPLLPGLVELDRQLVAVDGDDVAVAEF